MKIPFSPSVYEHAAALLGETPWRVSRDVELLVSAHRTAWELYGHSPVVVGIDIYNLEAEAYGAVVREPRGNGIPAITQPLLGSAAEGRDLSPLDPHTAGRLPMIVEAARRLTNSLPEATLAVPVSGPFSIATSLLGDRLLLEVALAPREVADFLQRLVEGQLRFCEVLHAAGLRPALFESAAAPPLLSPQQFREVELPPLKRLVDGVRDLTGESLPCIVGGNTAPLLPDILETGANYVICPAETSRDAFFAQLGDRSEVSVRVNLDPQLVARGPRAALLTAVDEVVALAAGRPNVLLGTGAVPYETPPANLLSIRDYLAD